jgi:hemoglobin
MDERSPYERLGGAAAVRRLVDRFYDHMEQLPADSALRGMHPADLSGSRDKLFEFLSGWLGGPPLYVNRRGHPRLRARHLGFAIGEAERDDWMACMRAALEECIAEPLLREQLATSLARVAEHMRNR